MIKESKATRITYALLAVYVIILFWILLFKLGVRFSYMENRSANFIPFAEPLISNGKVDVSEIILNVMIFIPLGICAGVLFKSWSVVRKLLLFLSMSLIFEVLQFVLRIGAFDVTDIITNSTGGVIGLITHGILEKIFGHKSHGLINIIFSTGTAVMVLLLLLLKLNLLPIRYQ